jgi:hypothetical protein
MPCGTLTIMSKIVDDAVRVLRDLPEDVQAAAARAIIDYGAGYDDDVALSDEQVTEVERRIADPNRNFMSLSDTRHRLRHFGV